MSLLKFLLSLTVTLCALVTETAPQSSARRDPTPPRFRAAVEQVVLYAAVYDKKGQLVRNLSKDDFRVLEDDIPQEVTFFGADEGVPTVGLVLDVSGSMLYSLARTKRAATEFLNAQDSRSEFFLIAFNHEVRLRKDFTREVGDVKKALQGIEARGGTALYDAIYLGVEKAEKGSESKKVLVVFTDGVDKDSIYRFGELRDRIRRSEVQVHIVGFLQEEKSEFPRDPEVSREEVTIQLQEIARQSGGNAFFPEHGGELRAAFQSIARDMRHQYRLAYVSSNRRHDGTWRNIEVELKEDGESGRRVRARKGYFAKNPPKEPDSQNPGELQ